MTEDNWKLKLRYGKIQTPFKHFTAIGEGIVGDLEDGFSCPKGSAFMGMKTWALSTEQSADMLKVIGARLGFEVTGNVQVYETEPIDPPSEKPYGYSIQFTPFGESE